MSEAILDRAAWNALRDEMVGDCTDDAGTMVRLTENGVDIERFEGTSTVDVLGSRQATDVRIGHVQILCSRDRLVVLSHPGRFPVVEWRVLYDGPVFG